MNRSTWILISITAVALFGAASVFAQEATQAFDNPRALSSLTRDDVKSELSAAQREGSVGFHEASPAPEAPDVLSRSQVKAETREAQRLGQLRSNEAGSNQP